MFLVFSGNEFASIDCHSTSVNEPDWFAMMASAAFWCQKKVYYMHTSVCLCAMFCAKSSTLVGVLSDSYPLWGAIFKLHLFARRFVSACSAPLFAQMCADIAFRFLD